MAKFKTVNEALVNRADEFGDRDQMLIMSEFNGGHGSEKKVFSLFVGFCNVQFPSFHHF